jgi:hypothetical protein
MEPPPYVPSPDERLPPCFARLDGFRLHPTVFRPVGQRRASAFRDVVWPGLGWELLAKQAGIVIDHAWKSLACLL